MTSYLRRREVVSCHGWSYVSLCSRKPCPVSWARWTITNKNSQRSFSPRSRYLSELPTAGRIVSSIEGLFQIRTECTDILRVPLSWVARLLQSALWSLHTDGSSGSSCLWCFDLHLWHGMQNFFILTSRLARSHMDKVMFTLCSFQILLLFDHACKRTS